MDVSVLDPRKLDPRKLDPRILDPRKLRPMTYGAEMREIAMVAIDSCGEHRVRFALTALGMVIGTASLILVVTIGLTGKHYVLNQIQSIGANLIEAEYLGGGQRATPVAPDYLTLDDMKAVRQEVPGIKAASPVISINERLPLGQGREGDVLILGVSPEYVYVRSLVIEPRHRPDSTYDIYNLTKLVSVANKTANALTAVLLLIATVTLVVSGVGIMNIMFVTVRSRTREIGIRKAVGATRREIRLQFLVEAIFISAAGGMIGTFLGMAIPISVRLFTEYHLPISGLSIIVAVLVSSLVGLIFGTVPASRAANLDPVESLRYE